nr:hypothetical protein [Lachnospiraceae bacterium]
MSIDIIENVLTLLVTIVGLLMALFNYIETPKRGWMAVSLFFLAHLLSDYYWTIYTLVIGENPDVSAFMAYFGWNVSYAILLILAIHMRPKEEKLLFHPVLLVPIFLNIWQFMIYNRFGGFLNNLYEGVVATAAVCVSCQAIISYVKNRKNGAAFPWLHGVILAYFTCEYGMWTSSCYFWENSITNPYYCFSFLGGASLLLLSWALKKVYKTRGYVDPETDTRGMTFQIILEFAVFVILFLCCAGGYSVARIMEQNYPTGEGRN